MRARAALLSLALLSRAVAAQSPAVPPSPETQFGFRVGSDRQLADADAIEKYFEAVAASSDRVRIIDLGRTTEGHRTIAAVVSAADNIRNLDLIRAANQRLADPRTLSESDARRAAASGKAVIAIGASIHATEIGATQTAVELLYSLVSATDTATLDELQRLIVIIIPMLNPDGHRLVVDWYNKNKGTAVEGGAMPWPDHKYAGHDINRDAFMMNLAESRNLARFLYSEWHPQVFLSMHEMDESGPRFFTPPVIDPPQPNVDPMIWREAALFGSAMNVALEDEQRSGVVSNALFDYYAPGYEDTAPLGHNIVGLLIEASRVKVATPITVPKSGESPHINAPRPWTGGPWTLRDIVEYELSSLRGLLRASAAYRNDLLWNFYAMGERAVEAGRKSAPFAYVIPAVQEDVLAAVKLEQLLLDGGIEVERSSEPFTASGVSYPAGTDIIFLAQPYRAYVKTLLERQDYPTAAETRPYDVTGWTLPAQMGVDVRTIDQPFESPVMSPLSSPAVVPPRVTIWGDRKPTHYFIETRSNAGALAANRLLAAHVKASWLDTATDINGFHYAAGSLVVPAEKNTLQTLQAIVRPLALRVDGVRSKTAPASHPVSRSRVGLYKPWGDDPDEGWTRWVLEQYEFPFTSVSPMDVRAGNLSGRFDVIILPSASSDSLVRGMSADEVPRQYAGGLGTDGLAALDAFVRSGGTLVGLGASGGLAIDLFKLPIRDVAHEASDSLVAPGTILRLSTDETDPLAYGMPKDTAGVFASGAVYEVDGASKVKTAVRYAARDPLISGLLRGGELLAGRSAVVSTSVGSGRVVLIGIRPQHRGQTLATFRLLFNAILFSRP